VEPFKVNYEEGREPVQAHSFSDLRSLLSFLAFVPSVWVKFLLSCEFLQALSEGN
jgi:hypothetical protein